METKKKTIEIRQDELSEILGVIPPWIIRWGSIVFSAVVLLLLAGALWVKFPVIVRTSFTIDGSAQTTDHASGFFHKAVLKVPGAVGGQVGAGMKAVLRIDSYPYIRNGVINAVIDTIEYQKGTDSCRLLIRLPERVISSVDKELLLKEGMQGTALLTTGRKSLFGRITSSAYGR